MAKIRLEPGSGLSAAGSSNLNWLTPPGCGLADMQGVYGNVFDLQKLVGEQVAANSIRMLI